MARAPVSPSGAELETTGAWVDQCLKCDAGTDAAHWTVLTRFLRAARSGTSTLPYLKERVVVRMTVSDRSHGSGKAEIEVDASAFAHAVPVPVKVDGDGWTTSPEENRPHTWTLEIDLENDLDMVIDDCGSAARVEAGKVTLVSLSGYLTLSAELVDTPQGPRIGIIEKHVEDPG